MNAIYWPCVYALSVSLFNCLCFLSSFVQSVFTQSLHAACTKWCVCGDHGRSTLVYACVHAYVCVHVCMRCGVGGVVILACHQT